MSGKDKKKFGAFKIIAIVVVVLVIALIALPFFIDVNQFRPEIENRLSAALGRTVKTGDLSLSIFSGALGVEDISIADDPAFSSDPFLQAKSFKVGVELKPLIFSKDLYITEISLDGPSINLIRSADGRWNFSSLGAGAGSKKKESSNGGSGGFSGDDVAIKSLAIKDGTITINKGGKKTVYSNVDITAKNLSFVSEFPFTLSAALPGQGSLSLEGSAGPISKTDMIKTPLMANLEVEGFNLVESGFVTPESGFAGIIDFDGLLTSNGRQMESRGSATADNLQLVKTGSPAPRPVSLEYAVNYDLAQNKGALDNAKMTYGGAVANLNGTFQRRRNALDMTMRLFGKDMPVEEVQTILPAFGVVLPNGASLAGGLLNADLTASGPVDKLGITGSADISNTSLVGFDLVNKVATVAQLAGISSSGGGSTEIETLVSSVRMTPENIRINPFKLVVPAIGELTGSGVINNPDQSLDFKMQARLKASEQLSGSLAQMLGSSGGNVTIPFFIRGTASEPKFVPDVKSTTKSIIESQLKGRVGEEGGSSTEKAIGDVLKGLLGD